MFEAVQASLTYEHVHDDVCQTILNAPLVSPDAITLLTALGHYDEAIYQHSLRVAGFCWDLARVVPLTDADHEVVWLAGLLHDCGKLLIPKRVLHQSGALAPTEWRIMQRHVMESVHLLESFGGFSHILPIVAGHQERPDGEGYPLGIASALPTAHVLSLADALDTMVNGRPALSAAAIRRTLHYEAGRRWDEKLARHVRWVWPFGATPAVERHGFRPILATALS